MSMTIYFAKLNLISDDLFNMYDYPIIRKDITYALYEAVNAKKCWEKENVFLDENGEEHKTTVEYSIHVLGIDKSGFYVEGWLYKKSKLFYNTLNNTSTGLIRQSTTNTEGIRFAIDLNHGFVGYNTTSRFGYKEFIEAFCEVINISEEHCKYNYRYNASLCTSGFDLEDIKKGLKHIGEIKDLRIRMQPPNPSEDLLASLQERTDGLVKDFKEANVTEMELIYSTKGKSGINIDSRFIDEKISDLQGLYSTLPIEESTKKGYVSVNATSMTGQKFASGDAKPIKRIIDGIEEFFESCVDALKQLN